MPKLISLCEHVFANGNCCGSPSLKDSDFCYWHDSARSRRASRQNALVVPPEKASLHMPFVEDADSLMVSLQEIMHALAENRIDRSRAALMLYAVQCSAQILPKLSRRESLRKRHATQRVAEGEDLTLPAQGGEVPGAPSSTPAVGV